MLGPGVLGPGVLAEAPQASRLGTPTVFRADEQSSGPALPVLGRPHPGSLCFPALVSWPVDRAVVLSEVQSSVTLKVASSGQAETLAATSPPLVTAADSLGTSQAPGRWL